MKDLSLIGFCGVECGECGDYKTGTCKGCRASVSDGFDDCGAIRCCLEKGIAACGECTDFPCGSMSEFYQESESHKKAYRLIRELYS